MSMGGAQWMQRERERGAGQSEVHSQCMTREGDALGAYSSVLQHHVWNIDPEEGLGLTDNSICTYTFMGNWRDIGTYMCSVRVVRTLWLGWPC